MSITIMVRRERRGGYSADPISIPGNPPEIWGADTKEDAVDLLVSLIKEDKAYINWLDNCYQVIECCCRQGKN